MHVSCAESGRIQGLRCDLALLCQHWFMSLEKPIFRCNMVLSSVMLTGPALQEKKDA